MKELPKNVTVYKRTPDFNEETVPAGLLKAHTTKEGSWGKICVTKGKLLYTIEAEPLESIELTPEIFGVVEPQVPHHVELLGEAEFHVEFLK
ncbi:DUF1971 domain-containing protein [Halobacteriovorax sp. HLS]|uniref:DUF1971 domain-containing protein n=1 Tax=Halobacteriovorax sp. HLS TaxID=2234000 RepID=UPI000FDABA75|nr:DUF1971 domain-containing protein [Halobacteriovorax sp. HLS]